MSSSGGAGRGPIRVERSGPGGVVARITIARPARRNALDLATILELRSAFDALAAEPPAELRAVVLAGDGPVFCAGADVAWMRDAAGMTAAENRDDALRLAAMLASIAACPVPVVARVHGAALGGGAGLCAVSDIVVADAGAQFGFPEVRLGLIAATIAPYVIARIGEGAAASLFTTGERIHATAARRIGLVHRVVRGEAALGAAVDGVVAAILSGGPEAVRSAKSLAREVGRALRTGATPESLAARTAELLADRRASAEAAEGLAAFDERRHPSWAPVEDEA